MDKLKGAANGLNSFTSLVSHNLPSLGLLKSTKIVFITLAGYAVLYVTVTSALKKPKKATAIVEPKHEEHVKH